MDTAKGNENNSSRQNIEKHASKTRGVVSSVIPNIRKIRVSMMDSLDSSADLVGDCDARREGVGHEIPI